MRMIASIRHSLPLISTHCHLRPLMTTRCMQASLSRALSEQRTFTAKATDERLRRTETTLEPMPDCLRLPLITSGRAADGL